MKIHIKQLVCTVCNSMSLFIHAHMCTPHNQYRCFHLYCSILLKELYANANRNLLLSPYVHKKAISCFSIIPTNIILSVFYKKRLLQQIKREDHTYPLFHHYYLLSTIKVTGPSLIKETSIIAPNRPVSTCSPCLRSSSLKKSYKRSA